MVQISCILEHDVFTAISRFSLDADSWRTCIWRKNESWYHPFLIWEKDHYSDEGVMKEILEPYVKLFIGAIGPGFLLTDDITRLHRAQFVDEYVESVDTYRMNWLAR
ncbi:transposable element Tc1 transposase [Trichonephila clavipes]|nr:transposable element Tc1 transposase [Trichonephila clavipes]